MYLRVAFLLLAAVSVSAKDLTIFVLPPGHPHAFYSTLEMLGRYDSGGDMSNVQELVLLASKPGEDTVDNLLGRVNRTGVFKGSDETGYTLRGSSREWEISVVWEKADGGYCRTYVAKVSFLDDDGQTQFDYANVDVGSHDGSDCPKIVQIPEYIQDGFPDATHEQQVQILNKLNSIDTNTYSVSNIYKGRVFLASMKDKNFQFHKMNELCKTAGGYLLELEDQDEQWAVRDFLKDIGSYNYYIGGNDVDSEGNYVNYNSKKPMTNVVWAPGEPNNAGNEDCVEIKKNGLNDNQCGREHGYLCELPLL